MMSPDSGGEITLTVKRTVAYSRERVYAAWTDPLSVKNWFAPGGMEAKDVEMHVRPGGSFRIGMRGRTAKRSMPSANIEKSLRLSAWYPPGYGKAMMIFPRPSSRSSFMNGADRLR